MPHVPFPKSQTGRSGQKNNSDFSKTASETRARDSVRTAYSGDENLGAAHKAKTRPSFERVKARRLPAKSDKTPIR